ncbi:MAG: four helix bundle protein [Sphingobacteriales bacterium]|nr:four helix bundle protein [Sphingobacteriales bacterium]
MRDYKKLEVWKKSHEMYLYVKKNIAVKFPKEEKYELTSQLQRAALSVPLNIVEGCGRFTDKDFAHFLDNSLGSINETDYCSFAAFELAYISEQEYQTINKLVNEVRAMIISFLKFLRSEKP